MKKLLSIAMVLSMLLSCFPLPARAEAVTGETPPAQIQIDPEVPEDASQDAPGVVPEKAPTDTSSEEPEAVPGDAPEDTPSEEPEAVPENTPADAPSDAPGDAPSDAPGDVPTDAPGDVPSDAPGDVPTDAPVEVPAETPEGETVPVPEDATDPAGETTPQTVSVKFLCTPEDLKLQVFSGEQEVLPREDQKHCYDLLPGTYTYRAQAKGYAELESGELAVENTAETLEVTVSLNPVIGRIELPKPQDLAPIEMEFPDLGVDSQELLNGYLERAFYYGNNVSLFGTAGRDSLTYPEQQLYDVMRTRFRKVASGEESSTEIPASITYTARELGISRVADVDTGGYPSASAELTQRLETLYNMRSVMSAVMEDSPFDIYWMDRGRGYLYYRPYVEWLDGEANTVTIATEVDVPVSPLYAVSGSVGERGSYRADTNATGRNGVAARAGENARNVVFQNQNLNDLEKLNAYKHYICTQVNYDHDAANSGINDQNGGGPWAIINVFDENPATNVVCEGYAKSFQYLCDLSDFYSDITCYQDRGGGHMWNIVDIDGVQVVTDVTGVDQDGWEADAAFLATVTYTSTGYNVAGWIDYEGGKYRPAATADRLSAVSLSIPAPAAGMTPVTSLQGNGYRAMIQWSPAVSGGKFKAGTAYEAHILLQPTKAPFADGLQVTVNGTTRQFTRGNAGFTKTCSLSFDETDSAVGWTLVGNQWRYVHPDGSFTRNGWETIDDQRYHFDKDGFRQTGFIQVGRYWYYLNGDGQMQTGWQEVYGKRYYLRENGQMVTGWFDLDGYRYYFNGQGHMQTGWQEFDGKIYYFDSQGQMQTGWLTIGLNTYYFDAQGVLARDTWIGESYVDPEGVLDPNRVRNQFRDEEGGRRYYDFEGNYVTDPWIQIQGQYCSFDENGYLRRNCWFTYDDLKCYLDDDGHPVDGWQEIQGKTYYFEYGWLVTDRWIDDNRYVDQDGVLQEPQDHWVLKEVAPDDFRWKYLYADGSYAGPGWQEIQGKRYYFDAQSCMLEQWQRIGGTWYYLTRNGLWTDGWMKDGDRDHQRYLDSQGRAVTGWYDINGHTYFFDENAYMVTGWRSIDFKMYYLSEESSTLGRKVTGWCTIGDYRYHFDEQGVLEIGWKTIDGETYYLGQDGQMQTGWMELGGSTYYFSTQGHMQTGLTEIEGAYYFFEKNGELGPGGWVEENGLKYYLEDGGTLAVGFCKIGRDWYFFNEAGEMQTGWRMADGKKRFFDADGRMIPSGWIEDGGFRYYLDRDGSVTVGRKKLGRDWYLFGEDGRMLTGWQSVGQERFYLDGLGHMLMNWQTIDGDRYYLNRDGHMQTGWLKQGRNVYYFGDSGIMRTGWQDIQGERYYFSGEGLRLSGWQNIGGNRYYFSTEGIMARDQWVDEQYLDAQGRLDPDKFFPKWIREGRNYWYRHEDGGRTRSDWEQIDGLWYHFDEKGYRQTGWLDDGGEKYYLDRDGSAAIGLQKVGRAQFLFDDRGAMQTGWHEVNGGPRYFKPTGELVLNSWAEKDGHRCYVDRTGSLMTGLKKIGRYQYYFSPEGYLLTGKQKVNGKDMYFNDRGELVTRGFLELNGETYYLDRKGNRVTGQVKVGRDYYRFGEDYRMLTGWYQENGQKYYYQEDPENAGKMAIGWLEIGGQRYYFQKDGHLHTGWLKQGRYQYYLALEDGHMLTGTHVIDGVDCTFGADGKLITKK